MSNINKTK